MSYYEPLPDSTVCEEGQFHIISPYTTEIEDIRTSRDDLVVGVSKITGIEASPVKSKDKYTGEEKKHHEPPGHSSKIKLPKLEKVAVPKEREDSIQDQLYNSCLTGNLTLIKNILDKHFVTLMPDENGQTPLFAACIGHQREVVEYLIHYGYDVNHQDNEGKTPLHITFEYDQPDIARILINQFSASYKIRDAQGWTPLHSAIDRGYFSVSLRLIQEFLEHDTGTDLSWIQLHAVCHERRQQNVQFLLDTKADVDHVSSSGFTALYLACRENSIAIMKCLLEQGANPNIVCSNCKTACHKAVSSGNCEAVECLLRCPTIDLNIPNGDGDTYLHLAVKRNSLDIVNLLLRYDVDIDRINHRCLTALHIAVAKRRPDIAHALLKKNANTNLPDYDGHTPLHLAAMHRDQTMVKVLCQYQPQPDIKTTNGITALHIASHKAEEAIMKELLALGADPNVRDPDGDTCLLMTINARNESCIAMLLQAGADVNQVDSDGDSCLHVAIQKRISKKTIRALVAHEAIVDTINNKCQTPLLLACAKRQLELVDVLVDAGACPDIQDHSGNSSLHIAVHRGFTAAIPLLVRNSSNINCRNDCLETSLFLASAKKNTDMVKVLLEAGADPDVCGKEEITCLQVACSISHLELVRLLLPHSSNVNRMNLRQHTALILACANRDVDIARSLLEAGANPNIADRSGDNCLHMAIIKHIPDLVEAILRHDIDINAKNQRGHTALFIASAKGKTGMAKMLMEQGAKLDVPDDKHNTPLHMAIACDALDIVHELLTHGADVNYEGQQAMTPLHTAVMQGVEETVMTILQHQPNIDCQDNDGDTPLHVACRLVHSNKAALLLASGANTQIKNLSGRLPLYYAVRSSEKRVLEAFEQHDSLNSLIDSCETALHYYCRRGNASMVEWLVEHGADKDKVCVRGSPLDAALDSKHVHIVFLLIEAGVKVSKLPIGSRIGFLEKVYRQRHIHFNILKHMIESEKCAIDLREVNEDGETLFFQACKDEAMEVIQLLLDCPRDIGVDVVNKFGKSAVSIVCESAVQSDYDAVSILSMLVQSGRDLNVDVADYQRMTPLHIACQNGSLMMVNMLLRVSTASVNSCNAMDRTPLHFATTADMVKLLLRFGADPDKCDYLGQTPLLFSCQQGHQEVASALLKIQPDAIHSRNEMGRTVMHHCTAARILEVLKDMCDLPVNEVDINRQSALHIAVMNDDEQSVRELLKMGANSNVMDKCSLSPIHIAKSRCLYELLKKHGADTAAKSEYGSTPEDMHKWHQQLREAETTEIYPTLARERHDYMQKIIDMPLVGFIEKQEAQEKEYYYVKHLLKRFILRLADQVQKVDDDLEIDVMPSGSMNEGTKVCMPDEGDFICLLTKFSKMMQEPKKFSFQTANVTLNLREEFMDEKPDFVDHDGHVMTQLLFQRFYNAVHQALAVRDIWTEFPELYRFEADDITKLNSKISNVNLMFHGRVFKWMPISVDVVPGILFPNGWQPSWCQDRAVLRDTQCCIVAKKIEHAPEELRPYLFQLGFTDADAEMFNRMSPHLKDGYKLAKLMRQPRICKPRKKTGQELAPASSYISSYMLKTVTFHLYEESLKSPEKFQLVEGVLPAVQFASMIYDKLADALKQDFLEMYPIAAHDLLRNHYKIQDDNGSDYKIAKVYCKTIRHLLAGTGMVPEEI